MSKAAETIQSESDLTSPTWAADQILIEKMQPTLTASSGNDDLEDLREWGSRISEAAETI